MFVLYIISGITVFTLVTLFWHILQKYYIFQNQRLCVFLLLLLLTYHLGILRWFILCHHRLRDMYVRCYTYRDQCSVNELMRK